MRNLFDPERAEEVKARLAGLQPTSTRLWGKMTAPQALAHCCASFQMALGDTRPPRKLIGRLIGGFIKPLALGDDAPMRRNSPTVDAMIISGERDLAVERARLVGFIDRFVAGGAAGCAVHPHPFFGPLTPEQWAILMYKHTDHHLRQFGA